MSDIVSLNLDEAQDLLGHAAPRDLFGQLCTLIPQVTIVLRMGNRGAFVGNVESGAFHVQPPRHPVIDVTGGGNAFSGGFLAGLCNRPGDVVHAGRCAAAAAAIAIAQRGPPPVPPEPELLDQLYHATTIRPIGSPDLPIILSKEPDVPVR